MKKETWILVANSSLAKIFKIEKNSILTEVKEMTHPESRLHEGDLVSSRPGRTYESVGTARHAIEPHHTQKHEEFTIFAKFISGYLDTAREEGKYGKLYISAGPAFLGILRQTFSLATNQLIAGEIDKDLTHTATTEIRSHLPPVV